VSFTGRRLWKRIQRISQSSGGSSLPRPSSITICPRRTTSVKIYSLQPQLDVSAQSHIRFRLWLKCLYNIAQTELTTLDPLGAFYLVVLDADWNLWSQNINVLEPFAHAQLLLCPLRIQPMPKPGVSGLTPSLIKNSKNNSVSKPIFTHSAICLSLGTVTLNEINSKHQFSTVSLSPLDSVMELKTMFGNITSSVGVWFG
jgi:hypothetical protein